MLRSLILLAVVASACLPSAALAQGGGTTPRSSSSFEAAIYEGRARPFIAIDYGMATPRFKGAGFDFESIGLLEVKLGYTDLDSVSSSVVSLMDSYLFASWGSADFGSSGGDGDVGSKFNRFGGGSRLGYGYQGKSRGLDLYNQNSMNWTQVEATDYDAADPEAQAIFDRYGSSYRFGQLMEAGMKFRIAPALALSAGVEGAIIMPRYVFWPWLGSVAIYSGVQSMVEYFAGDILAASPKVGPVIYFLLKTGVSLGYYLASRDDMNWPFGYETPLTVESFKLGATFTF